jgi:hypothetical protein
MMVARLDETASTKRIAPKNTFLLYSSRQFPAGALCNFCDTLFLLIQYTATILFISTHVKVKAIARVQVPE